MRTRRYTLCRGYISLSAWPWVPMFLVLILAATSLFANEAPQTRVPQTAPESVNDGSNWAGLFTQTPERSEGQRPEAGKQSCPYLFLATPVSGQEIQFPYTFSYTWLSCNIRDEMYLLISDNPGFLGYYELPVSDPMGGFETISQSQWDQIELTLGQHDVYYWTIVWDDIFGTIYNIPVSVYAAFSAAGDRPLVRLSTTSRTVFCGRDELDDLLVVTIYNDGNAVLSLDSVTQIPQRSWLRVLPASFTVPAGGSTTVSVEVDCGLALAGRTTTAIDFATNAGTARLDLSVEKEAPCTYGVSPGSVRFEASGGVRSFSVTAPTGCSWEVSGLPAWLTLVSQAMGTGNATVRIEAAANLDSAPRSSTVTVADTEVVIAQDGALSNAGNLRISPTTRSVVCGEVLGASGGALAATTSTFEIINVGEDTSSAGDITITGINLTPLGGWATVSPSPPFSLAARASREITVTFDCTLAPPGSQDLLLTVESADGYPQTRITLANGEDCTMQVSPAERVFPAEGGSGSVNIGTQSGCGWVVQVSVPWVRVSAERGIGPGSLAYFVDPHTGGSPRFGQILVGGQVVSITQSKPVEGNPEEGEAQVSEGVIEGAVLDLATGAPVEGAAVQAQLALDVLGESTTGANGEFLLNIPSEFEAVQLVARAEGYDSLSLQEVRPPRRVTLRLPPSAPETPIGLDAQAGASGITVRWNANVEADLQGYHLYRSVDGGAFERLTGEPVPEVFYEDTDVVRNSEYTYQATSVDQAGNESPPTAETVPVVFGEIVVWLPDVSGAPGDVVRIPVNINNATGINAAGLDVWVSIADPSLIDTGASPSVWVERTEITAGLNYIWNEDEPGVVKISSTAGVSALAGEGHMFNIFLALREDLGENAGTLVLFDRVRFSDETGEALDIDFADTGMLSVRDICVEGDINLDSFVDSGDVIKALRIAVLLEEAEGCQEFAGDMNGDGRVDSADAVMIQRLSVGLDLNPPQPEEAKQAGDDPLVTLLQGDPGRNISVDSGEAQPGDTVRLGISVDELLGVSGMELVLGYPSGALVLENAEAGPLTSDFQFSSQISSGFARLSMSRRTPLESGGGVVAYLDFAVSENAIFDAPLEVRLSDAELKSQYGGRFRWFTTVTKSDGEISRQSADAEGEGEGEGEGEAAAEGEGESAEGEMPGEGEGETEGEEEEEGGCGCAGNDGNEEKMGLLGSLDGRGGDGMILLAAAMLLGIASHIAPKRGRERGQAVTG